MPEARRGTGGMFARYLATGGAAAVVDFGGFVLLAGAGLAVAPAAALSFTIAAVVNFLLSARFAFGAEASRRRFALFFAFALCGLAINTAVTAAAVAGAGLPAALGKLCGIAVAVLFNFTVNALIVFPALRAPPLPSAAAATDGVAPQARAGPDARRR